MKPFLHNLFRSAVFWSYLAVALRSGAAILLLPLLLRKLSAEEMGLWYVFLALAGMGALLDIGFGNALNRATGYFWAGAEKLQEMGLGRREGETVTSTGPNYAGLATLAATMKRFYLMLGLILFLFLELAGGAWIWHKSAGLEHASAIRVAWAFFALGCSLNTIGSVWPNLLTGINGVQDSQKIFLISLVANYSLSIGGLLAGWGLWGPVSGQIAMGLLVRTLGRAAFLRRAGDQFRSEQGCPDFNLLRILWPNSWRVGAVTLGIYLTMYANAILASVFLDLPGTASFGLSLQMGFFISQMASIWVLVKIPLFNQQRQRGEITEIRRLFFARIWLFTLVFVAGSVGLCLFGDWLLVNVLGTRTQLLPVPQRALLLLVVGLEAHHSLYRELVQTANLNPFVRPMLLTAAASLTLVCVLSPALGVWGLILGPGIAQLVFNNWWIVLTGARSIGISGKEFFPAFAGGLRSLAASLREKIT